MAKPRGGLTKWFKENWVDISRPKKGGGYEKCGRSKAKSGKYPKCVPAAKAARMTAAQKRSAISRKEKQAILEANQLWLRLLSRRSVKLL